MHRHDARVVVIGLVDPRRDLVGAPVADTAARRAARARRPPSSDGSSHAAPRAAIEHDRHPIVDRLDELVRRTGDDREADAARGRCRPSRAPTARRTRRSGAARDGCTSASASRLAACASTRRSHRRGRGSACARAQSRNTCLASSDSTRALIISGGRAPGLVAPRTGSGPSASSRACARRHVA